jgi:GTP pyrophosphokinase
LQFIKTPKAKAIIMEALKSEIKGTQNQGQKILDDKLKEMGIKPQAKIYKKLAESYGLNNREELFSKIGASLMDLSDLQKHLKKNNSSKFVKYWGLQFFGNTKVPNSEASDKIDKKKDFLLKENPADKTLSYTVASCCNPIPGDRVIGFLKDNQEVVVHKSNCSEAILLAAREGEKIVKAKWSKHTVLSFLARIYMRGIDRIGVVNDVSQYITLVLSVNIRKILIETHDGIFEGYVDLYVHSTEDLDKLISNLSKVKGMEYVTRTEIVEDQN